MKTILNNISMKYKRTKEHSRKIGIANFGKKRSYATKLKMSLAHTGKKLSEKTKRKLSIAKTGISTKEWVVRGTSCYNWKGDNAGIESMHGWVKRIKGTPRKCEKCGTLKAKKYEWANIDHKYKRVLDDYIRLCTSCHMRYDIEFNGRMKMYETRRINKILKSNKE